MKSEKKIMKSKNLSKSAIFSIFAAKMGGRLHPKSSKHEQNREKHVKMSSFLQLNMTLKI